MFMTKRTIDDDIKDILALNARAAKAAKQADTKFAALKEKIAADMTTGDDIRDIAILHWNTLSNGVYGALKRVQSAFKKGKPVLLVQEEQRSLVQYLDSASDHSFRHSLIPPEDFNKVTDYHLRLAVLTHNAFYDRSTGALNLPARSCAETRTPYEPASWELREKELQIPKFELIGLISKEMGVPTPQDLFFVSQLRGITEPLKVFVGDEVVQYFSHAPYMHLSPDRGYLNAMALLGQKLPEDIAMKLAPDRKKQDK
ncbi:hypothetical protein HZB90_02260 [archaeon]|nr:hypothetical protein [archaeon]